MRTVHDSRGQIVSAVCALAAVVAAAAAAPAPAACLGANCRDDFVERSALRIGADGTPDVVAVGRSLRGTNVDGTDSAVAVLDAGGGLDPGFGGGDGRVLISVSAGRDEAHDVAVAPDGDLFVSGRADGDAYVARLNPDGSLDPACGGMDADPGVERFDPPGGDVQRAVLARTPDFVVAVQTATGEPGQLFKLTDACALAPGFGNAGFAALQFGAARLTAVRDIAVDGDGNILVGGGTAVAVGSLKPGGSINTGFGAGTGFLPASPAMPVVTGLAPRRGGGFYFNGGLRPRGRPASSRPTAAWSTAGSSASAPARTSRAGSPPATATCSPPAAPPPARPASHARTATRSPT